MLRLNTSVEPAKEPNRLGVLAGDLQGFPNGRRLADDAIDISLQAVEGAAQEGKLVEALAAGDKVDQNDNGFENEFPFLALPNTDSVNTSKGKEGAQADNSAYDKNGKEGKDKNGNVLKIAPVAAETGFAGSTSTALVAVGLLSLIGAGGVVFVRRRQTAAGSR
jgi:LPXTG-motif cell wall-anchored protein